MVFPLNDLFVLARIARRLVRDDGLTKSQLAEMYIQLELDDNGHARADIGPLVYPDEASDHASG